MIDKRLTEEEKKKIKPVNQAGGPNYLGKQEMVTVPKKRLSDPTHVVAALAYITPKEQKILLDADIYGSLDGKPNKGPGGIMSLQGDTGGYDRKISIANHDDSDSNTINLHLYDGTSTFVLVETVIPARATLILTDNLEFNLKRFNLRITTSSTADTTVIVY